MIFNSKLNSIWTVCLFTCFNESVRTLVIFYASNECYPSEPSQIHSERFWQGLKNHWDGSHSRLKANNT